MKEVLLKKPVFNSTAYSVNFSELHRRYATSSYGLSHGLQPPRYSQQYGYQRDAMLKDLGHDVHPVGHMPFTDIEIVKPLVAAQNTFGFEQFSPQQIVAIRLAAQLHDMGECQDEEIEAQTGCSVGDVWWETKNSSHDSDEAIIRRHIYSQLYPDLPGVLVDPAEDIIRNQAGSFEREAFHAAERIGYYQTAIRAGEIAMRLVEEQEAEDEDELRFLQLGRLSLRVSGNHREFLRQQSLRFPYIQAVLRKAEPADEKIHAKLTGQVPE